MPVQPVEFSRQSDLPRERCGNRVRIEDVDGVLIDADSPFPVDVIIVSESAWTELLDVVLDDDPTSANSSSHDISEHSALWVHIFIDSTGQPTNVRILAQFSDDNGVNWHDFEEGLWASLYWEDTDTASGIRKAFLLPCGGQNLVRFRAIGTGTGANDTFAVRIRVRAFRGNFGVAHA